MRAIFKSTPFASFTIILIFIFLLGSFVYKINRNISTTNELNKLISENITDSLSEEDLLEDITTKITKDNGWYYYIKATQEICKLYLTYDETPEITRKMLNSDNFDIYDIYNVEKIISVNNVKARRAIFSEMKNGNYKFDKIDAFIKKGNETKSISYGLSITDSALNVLYDATQSYNGPSKIKVIYDDMRILGAFRLENVSEAINSYYSAKTEYLIINKNYKEANQVICDRIDFINSTWSPELKKDGRISFSTLSSKTRIIKSLANELKTYVKEGLICDETLLNKLKELQKSINKNCSKEKFEQSYEMKCLGYMNQWDYATGEKDINKIFPKAESVQKILYKQNVQKSDINKMKIDSLKNLKDLKESPNAYYLFYPKSINELKAYIEQTTDTIERKQ